MSRYQGAAQSNLTLDQAFSRMQSLAPEHSRSAQNKHIDHYDSGRRGSRHDRYDKSQQDHPPWANPCSRTSLQHRPRDDTSRYLAPDVGHPSPPHTPSRIHTDADYNRRKLHQSKNTHSENRDYRHINLGTPTSERSSADWRHTVLGPTQHAPDSGHHRLRSPPTSPSPVSPSSSVDPSNFRLRLDQPASESCYLPRIRLPYDSPTSPGHPPPRNSSAYSRTEHPFYHADKSELSPHRRSSIDPTAGHPHYLHREPDACQSPQRSRDPQDVMVRRSSNPVDCTRMPCVSVLATSQQGGSTHNAHLVSPTTSHPQHQAGYPVYAPPRMRVDPQCASDYVFVHPQDPHLPPPTAQEMFELQRSYYYYYHAPLQTTRRRGNLPKDATEMLKKWLDENKDTPYPTEDQKKMFERETGLTLQQISNWFINARRRHLGRSGILGKNSGSSAGNSAVGNAHY